MSETAELSFRAMSERRGATAPPSPPQIVARSEVVLAPSRFPFDPWRLLTALGRSLPWALAGGVACAGLGAGLGMLRFQTLYLASASLIREEVPNSFQTNQTGEAFKPKQLAAGTLVSVIRAPSLLKKVALEARPPISPALLGRKLTITPERNTDVIRLDFEGAVSAAATASILNAYAEAVLQLTRDLQSREAAQVNRVLTQQLATIDAELAEAGQALLAFSREAQLISADKEIDAYLRQLGELSLKYESARIEAETTDLKLASLQSELARHNPAAARLQQAREELKGLLVRYTEAHPAVAEQRQRVETLEQEKSAAAAKPLDEAQLASSSAATSLYLEIVALRASRETMARQIEKIAKVRDGVQEKLAALPEKNVQYTRLHARQQSLETARALLGSRQREAQLFEESAPGYYRLLAPAALPDVGTKSRMPKVLLLALAGGLLGMVAVAVGALLRELADGRIKTAHDLSRLTRLPTILHVPDFSPGGESASWGFRAWGTLAGWMPALAKGPRVLGIVSDRAGAGCSKLAFLLAAAAAERGHSVLVVADRLPENGEAIARGHAAAEMLADPRALLLPGSGGHGWIDVLCTGEAWEWTRARREQWSGALAVWRAVRSLVIFIELPPPAGRSDVALLAQTLPGVLWLSRPGCQAEAVREQVEGLRASSCPLLGAAFARATRPSPAWLAKWIAAFALLAMLPASLAAEPMAAWQERLTLGAGDTVNLSLFGHPTLSRNDVPIGADGKLSYLEAHDLTAEGKTIDELRAALDAELGKIYRGAHTIVVPGLLRSKRYYLLGKVVDKGVFTLEQPLTILEAVARARGLETGLFQQNTVELADLPRAFLVRRGRRMPVDFEALFQRGELAQNLPLEPEDYLYFPSANTNEIYVLGAVKSPGLQGFTPNATVLSMVTVRGGFTEKAYLDRVLVVRGSLSKPETFVVDARQILKGRRVDFRLQPKDIVFVADRPWARAEELLDLALRTFVQAAAAGWASQSIGPLLHPSP